MPTTDSADQLPRALGLPHALSIVIGTVVGSAVFLVPHQMTEAVGSYALVNLAWIIGGLLSLAGALTYAELSAMRPFAGGEYVYLRDAYGDRTAFLYMWTWFVIAKPASIASVTTGLAITLAQLPAFAVLEQRIPHSPVLWSQLLAIAATWLITGLNCLGIRKAGDFQLAFTALKVALILAVVGLCLYPAGHTVAHSPLAFSSSRGGITGFMVALIAALWAYDGWNDLTMVGGEVHHPRRNLPLALVGGTAAVLLLYLGVSIALEQVLPAQAIAASPRPAMAALAVVTHPPLRHWAQQVLTIGMAVGILVGLNGTIMSGARVPYAAARDRLFFRTLANIYPRFQSPARALVVQGILSTILLLAVGRFQQLFELAIFAEWLFYALTATTIFVFRHREPQHPRPFQTPGYPITPALFLAASLVLLAYSYAASFTDSLIGTAIILAGLPVYTYFVKKRQAISESG